MKAKELKTNAPITYLTNDDGMDTEQLENFITMPFFSDTNIFSGVILISFKLGDMIALPRPQETCDNYYLIEDGNNIFLSSIGEHKHKHSTNKKTVSPQEVFSTLEEREGINEFSSNYDINGVEIIASSLPLKMASKTLKVLAWIPSSHINVLLSKYSRVYATGILFVILGLLGTYLMLFNWHMKLRNEIKFRKRIEADLHEAQEGLEKRVQDRTKTLSVVNKQLHEEIIQRREAIKNVREQNEFLNHVMESLTIPFYVINIHDYTVKIANSAAGFGLLSGKETCHQLTHNKPEPCECEEHPCTIEEIKRTKEPVILEHVHFSPDGSPRHVEVYGYPILNEDGTFDEIIEYSIDVTAKRKHEEELMKARNLKSIGRLASGIAHEIK